MRKLSPYFQPSTLAKLDGRTRESRLMRRLRADLAAHVGGQPSATQRMLIERSVQLSLQIALMEAKPTLTDHDGRQYITWTNALTRLMRQLGMKGAEQQPKSLAAHIAAKGGA